MVADHMPSRGGVHLLIIKQLRYYYSIRKASDINIYYVL